MPAHHELPDPVGRRRRNESARCHPERGGIVDLHLHGNLADDRLQLPGDQHRGSSLTSITIADSVPLNPGNASFNTSCPSTPVNLAPGTSETCTGSYTTDVTDVTNGSVVDDAIASANDVWFGEGPFNSAPSQFTVPYTGP